MLIAWKWFEKSSISWRAWIIHQGAEDMSHKIELSTKFQKSVDRKNCGEPRKPCFRSDAYSFIWLNLKYVSMLVLFALTQYEMQLNCRWICKWILLLPCGGQRGCLPSFPGHSTFNGPKTLNVFKRLATERQKSNVFRNIIQNNNGAFSHLHQIKKS